jgi:hypothetical protein
MANRRQFLRSGVAWSVASSSSLWASPSRAFAAAAPTLRPEHFVFDRRFALAVAVARHVAGAGVPLAETSGDLTPLWYERLNLAWKRAPAALAGLTTKPGLFVLETLAADYRMRVIYRGRHEMRDGGLVAHSLTGPAALIARLQARSTNEEWARSLARAMTQCPVDVRAAATFECTTRAVDAAVHAEPLFSWIIAPRSLVSADRPSEL